MSWEKELQFIFPILLSAFLGGLIGVERELHHNSAGIRTYAALCMGACIFSLISLHVAGQAPPGCFADPGRIAAQVVSGVGFLGAGVIFKNGMNAAGLTTAATLWGAAAVGMAVGFGMYFTAILSALVISFLLFLHDFKWWQAIFKKKNGSSVK